MQPTNGVDGKQAANVRKPGFLPAIHKAAKEWLTLHQPLGTFAVGDLEAAMGSSVEGGRRVSMVSDEELLRTIGQDLRSLYADIIRQPLPPKIEAALSRIDHAQRSGSNLTRPAAHWARTSPGL
jgi:hypothetical protein